MNKTKIRIIKSKIKYTSYKTKSPEHWTEYNKSISELLKLAEYLEVEYL